ncbi:MAG: isoprenylcysteine carboxylmethyltransferase family protein [Pseudomonadota bacterium]
MLDTLVIICTAATFASHVWSTRAHFVMSEMQPGAKLVVAKVLVGIATLSFITVYYEQPPTAQWLGLGLVCVAFILFWVTVRETRSARLRAVFTKADPASLVRTGPYAFVRHPFYTSYLTFWAGLAISSWSVIGAVFFIGSFCIYWYAAGVEEQKFLASDMADDYREFAANRARFFPPFL